MRPTKIDADTVAKNKSINTQMTSLHTLKQPYIIALLGCILSAGSITAQSNDTNDLENWTTIGLEYTLNDKWDFGLEEQLRLDENISEISKYFTELTANYSVSKKLYIGGGIRYIRENDNQGKKQGYENHFRAHIDAAYKRKANDFYLKFRLRYQRQNELGVDASEGVDAKQHIRFRTSLTYRIKNWKLDPRFSAEIFNRLDMGTQSGFDKYRLTLGTVYKLNSGKLHLFYRIQKALNTNTPRTDNILGIKYIHNLTTN